LSPDERRSQLVSCGLRLAGELPIGQVTADNVAGAAGVSRTLVFHYFPTTGDLHVAVLRAAAEELVTKLEVDRGGTPAERLHSGLATFVEYLEQQPDTYRAIVRGTGWDPRMSEVFEEVRNRVVGLIAAALDYRTLPDGLRLAVRGWIALVEEMVLHWLGGTAIGRKELIGYLDRAAFVLLQEALVFGETEPDPEVSIPVEGKTSSRKAAV
jgi:AcrR family transcriptional regulator